MARAGFAKQPDFDASQSQIPVQQPY